MKKYALMQAPIAENEYSAQITLVDTSTYEGKKRIENLRSNGYLHVGWIESDYSPRQLNAGFEYECQKAIAETVNLINQLLALLGDSTDSQEDSKCQRM